jgi:hypothetical protein
MPRHAIETPRSRTLWPAAVQSARRVPLSAAGRRVTPSHAKPAVVPEWRQRLTRNQRRMLKHAGHRLLVSPWFAAGAGVVIATGAIIYSPHAQLSPAIEISQCKLDSCVKLSPQVVPLQVGPGSRVTASPSTSSLPAVLTVRYQRLNDSTQSFAMWVKFQAPRNRQWKLSFVIRGATSIYVYDVPHWQANGIDGVTVSNYYVGTESDSYARIFAAQRADGWPSTDGDTVLFQIRGSGSPGAPSQCSFSLGHCQFKASNDLAPDTWSGSY